MNPEPLSLSELKNYVKKPVYLLNFAKGKGYWTILYDYYDSPELGLYFTFFSPHIFYEEKREWGYRTAWLPFKEEVNYCDYRKD